MSQPQTPEAPAQSLPSDAHLRSADFFDVENHPQISFPGKLTERTGDINFKAVADLTIRGSRTHTRFAEPNPSARST